MSDSRFNIEIVSAARREIKSLSYSDVFMVKETISCLEMYPFPEGCRKIQGYRESVYRVKTGDRRYRIIYKVDTKMKKVVILRVALRKDVYKKLHNLIRRA